MGQGLGSGGHERIAAAIRAAEAHTSGEIYCVVARRSDSYFYPATFFVSLTVTMASLAVAIVLEQMWISVRVPVFVAAAACALAAAWLVLAAAPGLRIRFVPRRLRYRRAHDNALKQFLAHNVHRTEARTGVLVFVSLEERYAVVLADSGINAKVNQETWNGIVAGLVGKARAGRLAEGLEEAVAAVGALLSRHFPRDAADRNELADHVVEI